MTNKQKQDRKKTGKSKQLTKKQRRARLGKKFNIPRFFLTRETLEYYGYDTANVNDSKMKKLASEIGTILDHGWYEAVEDAIQDTKELYIPKHPEKPAA
jgi:hypothetical protein